MVLYYDTHYAMFPTPSHQTTFNPYPYASNPMQQAPLSHYGSGQQGYDLGCPVSETMLQQGWHTPSVYPVSSTNGGSCARAATNPNNYEDWSQSQGSLSNPSPCSNVGMPVNLSSTTGQQCNFGLPTYRQHDIMTNCQGTISLADLVHPPDNGATTSTDESPSPCSGISSGLVPSPGIRNQPRPQPVRSPYEWMKRPSYQQPGQVLPGKTRTKDKYRVVYTDHQRLELEKEFHYSRYITIRRKTELATMLGLTERQVKIWFQNRRAKERKQARKQEEILRKEKEQVQHDITAGPGFGIANKPISAVINMNPGHCT
ncbi:homeobox protein CDX-1-like [Limulus polyphemus]|uniref:Homeobox protein CDX-1-like n=1 Tax=Limulus polyphemus TaxID=6850 RepID=A0ABM1BJS6_LIMPO|nr:homeobox protein CDX-1-like [Limulus polyphemus]